MLQVIAELPQKKQDVLRLKFQEGLSYKEISQVTGLTESYVGVLIHEGIQFIRERMKDDQPSIQGGAQ